MSLERQQLEAAISTIESCRGVMGDAAADIALVPLRQRLADAAPVPAEPAEQTLRQVSVLFLDVVGSTALSRQLDPESINAVMDGALRACTAIVVAHGGKVLQYAGDNLLAAFGAEVTRDNEAERAVCAGLALLEEGRRQRALVNQQHGQDGFDVRVGIHTGPALLGGGVDGKSSIRGIAVNVAARMEQTAPPGALRISAATWNLVRGLFDVQEQPPLVVKGLDAPIATYLVARSRPRDLWAGALDVAGVHTRMVGRDAELELLDQALVDSGRLARTSVWMLVGDAGIGKSRLLREFGDSRLARGHSVLRLRARALPQTEAQSYALLRDLVADGLGLDNPADGRGDGAALRDALVQAIVPLLEGDHGADIAQAHAHLLGHLIGLDFSTSPHVRGILSDRAQIRARAFHAALELLRRLAARAGVPLLVLLEDLHWADTGSLDFLDHLEQAGAELPLLVLATTRPSLFERRPPAAHPSHQRIDLQPLDPIASAALAEMLLDRVDDAPPALRELITRRAEGNPFYMEELVRMLLDEGALVVEGERWRVVSAKLDAAPVPATLTGLLQARLDRLALPDRIALQQAAVVGPVFWEQALAALDAAAPAAVAHLIERELITELPAAAPGAPREFAFRHQLLQQVAYDSVLRRDRRIWHNKVADFVAGLGAGPFGEYLARAAEHYDRGDNAARAAELYDRAARQGVERITSTEQLRMARRALALAPLAEPRRLWSLHRLCFGRCLTLQDSAGLQDHLAGMQAQAEVVDDDGLRVETQLQALYCGQAQARPQVVEQIVRLAERAEQSPRGVAPIPLLATMVEWAWALSQAGEQQRAEEVAAEVLSRARAADDPFNEVSALNTLAVAAWQRGDLALGLARMEQVLQAYRQQADRSGEVTALFNLCGFLRKLGDYDALRRCADQGLQLSRRIGNRRLEMMLLMRRAQLGNAQGQHLQALADGRAALHMATTQDPVGGRFWALLAIGHAEVGLGNGDAAAASFEQASALATEGSGMVVEALAGHIRAQLVRNDLPAAMAAAERLLAALNHPEKLDSTELPALRLAAYDALCAAGDARAGAMLATALAELGAQAARISDEALRQRFMQDVPTNRRVVQAAAAASAAALHT